MNLSKLYINFITIALIAIVIAIFTFTKMQNLAVNTKKMYTHPFLVSNAVSSIELSIVTMHRNMKDVVLTPDSLEMIKIIEDIQQEENKVYDSFKVIYKNYLGDKKDIDSSYNAFKSWKTIREKVITLVYQKKIHEAINITKGEGKEHIDDLYIQIGVLKKYALSKAEHFYKSSVEDSGINEVLITFFIGIFLSGVIIIFVVRSLLRANRNNAKQLHLIDQNILTANICLNKKILDISNALCRSFNVNKKDMIEKDCQYFFTDEKQYKLFETVIYSEKEYKGEVQIKTGDKKIWYYMEIYPEFNHDFALVSFTQLSHIKPNSF